MASLKVAFCWSPYHLLEALAFRDPATDMIILSPHAASYAGFLEDIPRLSLYPLERRDELLDALRKDKAPFDFYYATLENRTALKLEKMALDFGGHVHIFEDGIGGFGRPWPLNWRDWLLRIIYKIVDGTHPRNHIGDKPYDLKTTTLHSALPEAALPGLTVRELDFAKVQPLLPKIASHFEHLSKYRGIPAFFDTNDCEGGWYPYEQKLEILKDTLPSTPLLYFPHPNQRFNAAEHLSNLIDMTGLTHNWNEMACYYIQPPSVHSVFSTVGFSLRHIFQMKFTNVLMYEEFYRRTGHRGFGPAYISSSMKAMLHYSG